MKPKARRVLEKDVRRAIRDWLDLKQIPHIPIESRKPLRNAKGDIFFVNEQARDKGVADFIAFIDIIPWGDGGSADPIAIEAKRFPDGVQSDAQKEWQAWWEGLGFYYILARSVEDVVKAWPR